jgi:hypothetical protein
MRNAILAFCVTVLGGVAAAGEAADVIVVPSARPAASASCSCEDNCGSNCVCGCARVVRSSRKQTCVDGNCRVYSVDESARESTRRRLFGGQVTRANARTVVRPVR